LRSPSCFRGENDLLIGARKGSPLAIGYGDGEMYLGSDAIALAPFTDTISYLEDGESAVLTRKSVEVRDANGSKVERAVVKSLASALLVDKGNYRHFMAKEIHEQPEVVSHTLAVISTRRPSACGAVRKGPFRHERTVWFDNVSSVSVPSALASLDNSFNLIALTLDKGDIARHSCHRIGFCGLQIKTICF
jgi:hypothetical protein